MGTGVRRRQSTLEGGGSLDRSIEVWPYLDEALLPPSRSRKVCICCQGRTEDLHSQRGWASEVT
jgi:hypothetical protein